MAKIYRREPLVWIIRYVIPTNLAGNSSGRNVKRFASFFLLK